MDADWSSEQLALKKKITQFAQQELQGDLKTLDQQEVFNTEGWRKCGELGIQGLPIPQRYGGGGADILTTICALEALGYGCKDNGLIFAMNAHMWACEIPILTFGEEAQKARYLPKLCRGEWIGGHAASEPEAGSDVAHIQTTARREGDAYILNGRKLFVTNGPLADVLVVFATVDAAIGPKGITAFLVEKNTPGFKVQHQMSKMGLRTALMGDLTFTDCKVPVANRLGREGGGLSMFHHSMEWERGFILASAIGTMERVLEICLRYAKQRRQFGQPIGKFQLVADKMVEMKMRLETARALLHKVGRLKQQGKSAFMDAAMAKLYISEAWVQSCMDALQIHGGYGYLTEVELERELRDAIGSRLYSGTSEIQRQIIAQFMGL